MMGKKFIILSILLGLLAVGQCIAQDVPDVSAQDLLNPARFPKAQYGMSVESATNSFTSTVVTTGAEFLIKKNLNIIECYQRIGNHRLLATIRLVAGVLNNVTLTFQDTGAVIYSGGGTTVRINGDSLIMISPNKHGPLKAELAFTPDFHNTYQGNYNFFDPDGGISFFEHAKCPSTTFQAKTDPIYVTWAWTAGNVFWACVSPPKQYDWNAPTYNKTIVHGSSVDMYMYPSDYQIALWHKYNLADIIYLHYEPMWVHWNLDLTPKDPENLRRVCRAAHENNMKVIVYASPYYFIKDTPAEPNANPDPHYPVGWTIGSNAFLYMQYATKIIRDYGVDGLYWDSMYQWVGALATNYWLTRATRELIGDNNPLEYHATTDIIGPTVHTGPVCPVQHAYCSVIYKGEGEENLSSPSYIRYIASTYNVSNSIAVACFVNTPITYEQFDRLFKNNVHFHLPWHWMYSNDDEIYRQHYWPRLNAQLKDEILDDLTQRTGAFDQYRNSLP